jgi:hypothetical protein
MFRKYSTTKPEFLRAPQQKEILIRVIPDGIKQKRFDDEYLAGKDFDQKICSPFRDVVRSNKRLGRSLLPRNTARH